MSWYALEKIEEALNQTKDFLTPFDFGLWTRLAVLVLLLGGGFTSTPSGNYPSMDNGGGELATSNFAFSGADMTSSMHNGLTSHMGEITGAFGHETSLGLTVIAAALVIGIAFAVLSSIARFAFFQSAMEKQAGLTRMFKSNLGNGLQLIGFNLLVAAFALIPLIPYVLGLQFASVPGAFLLVAAIVYWFAILVAMTFVNDFGLPLMISEELNILAATKRALGTVRREKGQAAVYFLTKIGIGIVLGILSLIALIVAFLGLLIPFGILAMIAFLLSPIAAGIILFIGLFTLLVISLYIQVPLETYRHYFYLLNLEEFEDVELVER